MVASKLSVKFQEEKSMLNPHFHTPTYKPNYIIVSTFEVLFGSTPDSTSKTTQSPKHLYQAHYQEKNLVSPHCMHHANKLIHINIPT